MLFPVYPQRLKPLESRGLGYLVDLRIKQGYLLSSWRARVKFNVLFWHSFVTYQLNTVIFCAILFHVTLTTIIITLTCVFWDLRVCIYIAVLIKQCHENKTKFLRNSSLPIRDKLRWRAKYFLVLTIQPQDNSPHPPNHPSDFFTISNGTEIYLIKKWFQ